MNMSPAVKEILKSLATENGFVFDSPFVMVVSPNGTTLWMNEAINQKDGEARLILLRQKEDQLDDWIISFYERQDYETLHMEIKNVRISETNGQDQNGPTG